ncbi:hypothetical protein EU642_22340 [Salmonella enterica]|nr:hypothetical protein [Salmonella enterica]EAO0118594.1 hypothetical protein [Salmonella enterica]EAO3601697.1 hypothetical protein [Salmonella enterica]EAR6391592.1 hypothetical protein [Salmonella enterica]EAV1285356.1 hypothetical protein [Salmonella enterica]
MVSHFVKSLLAKSEAMQIPEPRDMLPKLPDVPEFPKETGTASVVDMYQYGPVVVLLINIGDLFYSRIDDEYYAWSKTQYTSGRTNICYWRKAPPITNDIRKQIDGAIDAF